MLNQFLIFLFDLYDENRRGCQEDVPQAKNIIDETALGTFLYLILFLFLEPLDLFVLVEQLKRKQPHEGTGSLACSTPANDHLIIVVSHNS
jgi:hypothetical protein